MNPMLAQASKRPFDDAVLDAVHDDSVMLDVKMDGRRLLVDLAGDTPVGWGRDGQPAAIPSRLSLFLRSQGSATIALDGELIGDTFWVFDLLMSQTPTQTLLHRRRLLETFLGRWSPPEDLVRLVPAALDTVGKAQLAQRVITEGLEGLVAKRLDSVYVPGKRSASWTKLKAVKEADFIITEMGIDGKDNFGLGLWTDGEIKRWGESSALTGDGPKIKQLIAAAGRGPGDDLRDLGIVVTITYLYVGAQGGLVQPVRPRLRTDKPADECTDDQLVLTRSPA